MQCPADIVRSHIMKTFTATEIAALNSADFHANEFTADRMGSVLRVTGVTETAIFYNEVPKYGGIATAFSSKLDRCGIEFTVTAR